VKASTLKPRTYAEVAKLAGPALLVTVLAFGLAYYFVGPAPPDRITIASGELDGAYYQFAERYREWLADFGIELEVRPTAGSAENVRLLEAGEVDAALVQGGVVPHTNGSGLLTLGSLFYEPLWVFHGSDVELSRLSELRGMRVAPGAVGSGTRAVALQLLEDNGVRDDAALANLVGREAAAALMQGRVDAVFLIASPRSPLIRELVSASPVSLMSFGRADAYTRTHRFLSRLTLPEGAIDLAANVPPHPIALLSPTANLAVGPDFHPALVDLLLQAAARVHGGGGLFERPGEFPAPRYLAFPLSAEARRHYEHGPPFLQRYLPFWAATLVDRLKVMLIPLFALLLPLFRVMPPVYRWRVRSRIYRWYKELRAVDPGGDAQAAAAGVDAALGELARIESEVSGVPAPPSYARELYDLRVHIDLVRAKLRERQAAEERE
jgi:TRAP transporter TAXI family solute receptor